MNRYQIFAMWMVVLSMTLVSVAETTTTSPASQPADKPLAAADFVGTWHLDREATIDRAVASSPDREKEKVRAELNILLPSQVYIFRADGSYDISHTGPDNKKMADAGTYSVEGMKLAMKSSTPKNNRKMVYAMEGEHLVLRTNLMLKKVAAK